MLDKSGQLERATTLGAKVIDPADEASEMGPLISAEQENMLGAPLKTQLEMGAEGMAPMFMAM